MNIEVVGINRSDQANNNSLVINQRSLPWLQDTSEAGLWSSWNVVWRDVRLVSSQQELADVYNLTSNDLNVPSNRSRLRQKLLALAVAEDADGDGLRDDWEALYLKDLAIASGSDDDPDGDGHSNFEEYAFGSHPRSHASIPQVRAWTGTDAQGTIWRGLVMKRRAGASVSYTCWQSGNLRDWQLAGTAVQWLDVTQTYDGTGTSLVHAAAPADISVDRRFLRIEAKPNEPEVGS